ncbi:MAG TPA: hypothetical protein ENH17_01495, partial [Nitrospirae bacterium]|nr:hypothetical protein [Nitrospirota bacterium]
MNPKFYHKIPADFMTGKAILILIVTLCSAFSFLLGYFVGKSQLEERPALMSMNTLTAPDEKAQDIFLQDKSRQTDDLLPSSAIEGKKNKDRTPALAAKTGAGNKSIRSVEKEKLNRKSTAEKTSGNKKTEVRKETSLYYTIQVGAFRNKQQAEKLKNLL